MSARTRTSPCSRTGCRRSTTDPSGACHDHRGVSGTIAHRPLPAPPAPVWESGRGTVHPTGGYDEIVQTDDGRTTIHRRNGKPHRLDGPAVVRIDPLSGGLRAEKWFLDGVQHREGAPAQHSYSASDGKIFQSVYFTNGVTHRPDGPTYYDLHPDGSVFLEEWRDETGVVSRLDGPAIRKFALSGEVDSESYVIGGVEYLPEEFDRIREALDSGAPLEWALAYASGPT